MPNGSFIHYALAFIDTLKDVFLGGIGGIVAYMYDYSKQKKTDEKVMWSTSAMLINMFLGGFTANAIGSFIPMDTLGRDGLIGFIGVSSYAILGLIESKFASAILNRIGIKK